MVHELKIPEAGESIQEVQIGQWLKQEGQWVERDENVVELETDKASMDLPAPVAGVLVEIRRKDGEAADVGDVIAVIDDAAEPAVQEEAGEAETATGPLPEPLIIMPAAQRLLSEHGLQGRDVEATGPQGRLLKEDVLRHLDKLRDEQAESPKQSPDTKTRSTEISTESARSSSTTAISQFGPAEGGVEREEKVVPMTLIRRRIAERLVQAQQQAALLTTVNEIDMSAVIGMRQRYRDRFHEKYGVKLGFMSFFTKGVVEQLKAFPALNAEIRDNQIVYRNYFDIGVAVGGGKGLVVPTLRSAERMSFAEIEQRIADFAARSKSNKIRPDELEGGTFTITNGGVYGSLLSTPIINPPQSGVLGLHAIQDRPVVVDGEIVVRPMMYVALTYDHRLVDGREAVTFLKGLKDTMEEPARLMLEV
jgi:2-oxoglutarate dehydrogenase E2 component (dihydrolipoamide succinyltransferase)